MYIVSLNLINFRNIHSLSLELSPCLNILWGKNGQGKTNILESLFLLATSRSFRTTHDQDLIFWGSTSCNVKAAISSISRRIQIEAGISLPHSHHRLKKQFHVNGIPIKKFSALVGLAPMVLFTPQDIEIVRGSPALRRSFIDYALSQTSASYLDTLQRYLLAVEQRNRLLREKGGRISFNELVSWNEQLINNGSYIIQKRLNLIKQLEPLIKEASLILSSEKEEVTVCYQSTICTGEPSALNQEELKRAFSKSLEEKHKEELERRQSLVGPHRDDMAVFLNKRSVRAFGSQGQQRSTALALKFAEWHYINNILEIPPILLLDDLFSELDKSRWAALAQLIRKTGQTFITSTEPFFTGFDCSDQPTMQLKIEQGGNYVLTA